MGLRPGPWLSKNEFDAAKLVTFDVFNPQHQPKFVWPASFVEARAYLDQLDRSRGLAKGRVSKVRGTLDKAEKQRGKKQADTLMKLAAELDRDVQGSSDPNRVMRLSASVTELAGAAH